jgi:hypothetical protein
MDEVDAIFLRIGEQAGARSPVIACFYTRSKLPPSCAPMLRVPEPDVGAVFNAGFPSILADALLRNPAVHDGAIMIGRAGRAMPYHITGWSYRLYPPEGPGGFEPNRGSAFNSCLAMSRVESVDRVYLKSKEKVIRFEKGRRIDIR